MCPKKVDKVREVAWISWYKPVPSADKGGKGQMI